MDICRQKVVPVSLREHTIHVEHDLPIAGHSGEWRIYDGMRDWSDRT